MRVQDEYCQGKNATPSAGWRAASPLRRVGRAQAKMREGAGHLIGDGDGGGENVRRFYRNASSVRRPYSSARPGDMEMSAAPTAPLPR